MVEAVKDRDIGAVRTLLRQRADVNAPAPDGSTALHWATHWDDGEIAALLLRAGANVNAVSELGVAPLYLACSNGSAAMVERLVAAGANAGISLPTGETPLMMCARTGSVAAVKSLLAHGADPNAREHSRDQTALMWAIAAGHPDVVRVLVEGGADIRARTRTRREFAFVGYRFFIAVRALTEKERQSMQYVDFGGYTPLHFAAQRGEVAAAGTLIAAGAPVNDPSAEGTTPLVVAAHSGHTAVARLLIDQGADVDDARAGYSALHAAVLRGDISLVTALLAGRANPNVRLTKGTPVRKYSKDYALGLNVLGATPYWLATRFAEPEIMRALVAGGADQTLAVDDGTPAVHAAISYRPGNGDRRDRYISPRESAALDPEQDERETLDTVRAALDLGTDVNTLSPSGDTPVHAAVARGYVSVVQLLVERGAALDVRNRAGKTAYEMAATPSRGAAGASASQGEAAGAMAERLTRIADLLQKSGARD
jgi:ankyrin repeat protein